MASIKEVAKCAKSLIDNRDFTVVMDYMVNDLLLKLTQGNPDTADSNLRNFKAAQALKEGVSLLANADAKKEMEHG